MSLDLKAANSTMAGLRTFPAAITTASGDRTNGLISLSAGSGGIIPEAPRVQVGLTQYNLTNDLVLESGVFVMHMLSNAPELIDVSLEIIMTLGGRSGRDGDKLGGFRTKTGVTGSPILLDALSYVEGRVIATMDTGESTVYVADVVAAGRLNGGSKLGIAEAWQKLPPQWIIDYEAGHEAQIEDSRRRRGLPSPH